MAIQIQGQIGTLVEVDGANYQALRVAIRPIDPGSLGSYMAALSGADTTHTNVMTAAAAITDAAMFSFRWGDISGKLCLIHRLEFRVHQITPTTAVVYTDFGFDAFVARSFTASHSGGEAPVLGPPNPANSFKMRASMPSTLLTDLRIVTTAALAGGAGIVYDENPFAQSIGFPTNVTATAAIQSRVNDPTLIWKSNVANGEHPLILSSSEGIVVRNRTAWPTAMTAVCCARISWTELASY
jgi:hypothetical protein